MKFEIFEFNIGSDYEDLETAYSTLKTQCNLLVSKSTMKHQLGEICSNLKILNSHNESITISLEPETLVSSSKEVIFQVKNSLNCDTSVYSLGENSQFLKILQTGLYKVQIILFDCERGISTVRIQTNDGNLILKSEPTVQKKKSDEIFSGLNSDRGSFRASNRVSMLRK